MNPRTTPPGGGHTADSETVRLALKAGHVPGCVVSEYGSEWANECKCGIPEALAALARLEQTIDGLRRERSSLEAAANRTAEAERDLLAENIRVIKYQRMAVAAEAERDAALADARACRSKMEANAANLNHVHDQRNAAEAERDAAHAALRDLTAVAAQYMDTGRGDLDGWIARARAVLGGPDA